jgi:hypothetical protein
MHMSGESLLVSPVVGLFDGWPAGQSVREGRHSGGETFIVLLDALRR